MLYRLDCRLARIFVSKLQKFQTLSRSTFIRNPLNPLPAPSRLLPLTPPLPRPPSLLPSLLPSCPQKTLSAFGLFAFFSFVLFNLLYLTSILSYRTLHVFQSPALLHAVSNAHAHLCSVSTLVQNFCLHLPCFFCFQYHYEPA